MLVTYIQKEEEGETRVYSFLGKLATFILKIFSKIKVIHPEHIPKDTGYIIACNHTGWMDIVSLGVAILPEQIHFMAKKELFQKMLPAAFLRSLNAFPVDRENPGPSAIKIPVKLLKEGKVVGIFPSGTRDDSAPMKRGAVTIANLAKYRSYRQLYRSGVLKNCCKKKLQSFLANRCIFQRGERRFAEEQEALSNKIHQLEQEILKMD